jgi:hypothetical protein
MKCTEYEVLITYILVAHIVCQGPTAANPLTGEGELSVLLVEQARTR